MVFEEHMSAMMGKVDMVNTSSGISTTQTQLHTFAYVHMLTMLISVFSLPKEHGDCYQNYHFQNGDVPLYLPL